MSTEKCKGTVLPYLFFDGRCEEALEFYRRAIGAEPFCVGRFKDAPDPAMCPPGAENRIMHAELRIGDTTVMVSDGRCTGKPVFAGFSLSLERPTEAEADKTFAALSEGGQVTMPIGKTFFADRFGMLTDKFGVPWMVVSGVEKRV